MTKHVEPSNPADPPAAWQAGFLALMPAIERQARFAFRSLRPEEREEAVQEVLADAATAYARLAVRGRVAVATATSLARYAVRHHRAGRRVGSRTNTRDVFSRAAQKRGGFTVRRLGQADPQVEAWRELLVDDRHATPADTAAARIDLAEWLRRLSDRLRRIAMLLARGERPCAVARLSCVSPARLSQIRAELRASWDRFHGSDPQHGRQLA